MSDRIKAFTDDELFLLEKALHDRCHSKYDNDDIARELLGEVLDERLERAGGDG